MPTTIAKDISFSELGLATEFSSEKSFRTQNATFFSNSTNPLEISLLTSFDCPYYLTIYWNDNHYNSSYLTGGQNKIMTISETSTNIRKGNNTLSIGGYTIGTCRFRPSRKLVIYGDSKISSPDIFLPPLILIPTTTKPSSQNINSTQTSIDTYILFLAILILIPLIKAISPNKQTYPKYKAKNQMNQEYITRKQTYQNYINSDEWKKSAKGFKSKSNGYCYLCGNYVGTSKLETHHIHYPKDIRYDNEKNWIAICSLCHRKLHGTEDYNN